MERLTRKRKPPAWHKDMIATGSKKASAGQDSSCQESESMDSEIPDDEIENGGDAVEIEEENIEGGKSEDEEEGTEKGKRRYKTSRVRQDSLVSLQHRPL